MSDEPTAPEDDDETGADAGGGSEEPAPERDPDTTGSGQDAPDREQDRAAALDRREATLAERESELDERERHLENREASLDDRETALGERRDELERLAEELDQREETLREYVGTELADLESSLSATVEDSVRRAATGSTDGRSRVSLLGNLVLALVGIVLVAAAVANAIAAQTPGMVRLFSSTTLNFAASGVLVVLGLAANLAGVTGRV